MRILLVAPTHKYREKPLPLLSVSDFPAGIAYIAASLEEAGHTVTGLNPNNAIDYDSAYYMLANKLSVAIETDKPDLIGLGGIVTDYQFLKDAIELCKKFAPNTPIVLGGGIISNDREFVFNLLKPDFALVGQAEETVVQLAEAITDQKPYNQIPNLAYWEAGNAVFNRMDYNYRSLDERPFPDYGIFGIDDMLDNYSMATRLLYRYSRPKPRPFTIVTARGCPFNCTFCIHRGNQFYRARSISNIMEEIKVTYERYRFNILIILDELFAVNKERMKEFCDALLSNKARYGWDFDWMFQTHASANLDYDTLALAKKAGCFFFSYGIESASPTVLKSMNKKIKVPQIIEAIRLAHETNIGFGGNLIFGDTAETQMTIYESLEFYRKYCTADMVFLGFLMPYPGNKLFDTCIEQGIIKDKAAYYANLDRGVPNMTAMPNEMWYQWVNYIGIEERSWLGIKATDGQMVEEPEYSDAITVQRKASLYRIKADCPYCGHHINYREVVGRRDSDWPVFLGTGCQRCNRRIKINLTVPKEAEKKVAVMVESNASR